MSPISAASTSAFIKYEGKWDRTNGLGAESISNVPGASFTIPFRGSSFSVYGQLGLPNEQLTVINRIDIAIDDEAPVSVFGTGGPILYEIPLNSSTMHTAKVQVVGGTFSFERVAWESGDTYSSAQTIDVRAASGYTTQGNWAREPGNLSSMCTGGYNDSITFNFRGNAIVIQGVAPFAPNGIALSATVDGETPPEQPMTVYEAIGTVHFIGNGMADLYRNDSLSEGDHVVTLTTRGGPLSLLCVSRALVYNVTALSPQVVSNETSSTEGSSANQTGGTSSDGSDAGTLSTGQIGGVAIGALLAFCFMIGGLLFLWRRRSSSRSVGYEDVMADEMVSMERNSPLACGVPGTTVLTPSTARGNNAP